MALGLKEGTTLDAVAAAVEDGKHGVADVVAAG